ncbi:MAG: PhnD/SsuA/transferrin family substrate-binding protein [Thermodesulfobacteriaceae bacterium]|nr:PhnD/SsuA/transferrin family substrate-binding protein [Thermodesulfobacteriaceae bacterium]MDW7973246.1 PhnD/SsuA/transferrin family substrate-binding protein [Thermodesulfovibrio sp.]MDW8136539.1 PhnD/SsuA/transferrin family substrate-binding protein [Thermodesulfobacterium sp.]
MYSLIVILIYLLIYINAAFAETIRFAPLPIHEKNILISHYKYLIKHLEDTTNLKIELLYIEDYRKLMEEFKKGNVHLITISPLLYYELKKEFPRVKIIAHFKERDGSIDLSCALITHAKGPNSLKEVKGPVAVGQKLSTCGYFAANIMLSQAGKSINKMKIKYFNTHNEIAEAVIREEFEIGSLRKDIAEQYKGFAIKILKVIKMGPSLSVAINPLVVSEPNIKKIQEALLSFNPLDKKDEFIGKYGLTKGREESFNIIKKYEKFKPKF